MKKILLITAFFLAILVNSVQAQSNIYPWMAKTGLVCSSITNGADHTLCFDSSSATLYKCSTSTGYCTTAMNISGTANNLSGTPTLPNGTMATTQTLGDSTATLATDAFVLANAGVGAVSSVSASSDKSLIITPSLGAVLAGVNWDDLGKLAGSGRAINWYDVTAVVNSITSSSYTGTGTTAGSITMYELPANGTTYVGFAAPAIVTSSGLYILPATDGLNGQALVTNGSKVLSFSAPITQVTSVTAGATPTIVAVDGVDFEITGLATAITSMTTNLSGTTTNGATIEIDITDAGTAEGLTFGSKFTTTTSPTAIVIPTTTTVSQRLRTWWQYNSTTNTWQIVGAV